MKKSTIYLGMAGLVLCAVHARAAMTLNVGDTITVSENNPFLQSGAETGFVNEGNSLAPSLDVYAGSFNVHLVDSTSGYVGNIMTFCTDVGIDWNPNPTVYTATGFGSVNGVNPAWSAVPESVQNAAWIYENYFVSQNPSTINPETAAAVQLAIWKVLYDSVTGGGLDAGGSSFSAGRFRASNFAGNTLSDASAMINTLETDRTDDTFTTYTETWLDPSLANSQGLLYNPSLGNNQVAVPEPATVLAGALLLLPLGASTYRIIRNRKMAV